MSVSVATDIQCPKCGDGHPSLMSLSGLRIIACPKVTPAGAVGGIYPRYEAPVIVIGAGDYADVTPPKPKTDAELYAELRAAEAAAAAPPVAGIPSRAEMEKKLAALQKAQTQAQPA